MLKNGEYQIISIMSQDDNLSVLNQCIYSDAWLNVSLQLSTWSSSTSLSSCLYGLTGRPSSASPPTPPKRYHKPIQQKQACVSVSCYWYKVNLMIALKSFFLPSHSSSAYPRLRKSVMRRKRGQSPSKRSYGELPPVCLCTPAQEPEVRLTYMRVQMWTRHVSPLCRCCPLTAYLLCWCDAAIRYCDRCQVIKPDRCHHCSACDM